MYRIIKGNSRGLRDVNDFIRFLNDPPTGLRNFFDDRKDIFLARAPGRLDVMGGIADYSGSLVLEMPIAEATLAAIQKSDEELIKIRSLSGNQSKDLQFEISLSELETISYERAREIFSLDSANHWAAYVGGIFPILRRECGFKFHNGARILLSSEVPLGKGVSSSAALEVATMQAVCAAFGILIETRRAAMLCQKIENLIVGAPCGVMDQIASHCGITNSLISLLCQPAEIQEIIEIPDEIEFWGIDSGVRHAVTGSDYASVRRGAFMGYRIIADLAGLKDRKVTDGVVKID
ncbi:MAG TPA: galactokinase family protein, partial [Pyrinomonadaceae bacterium]|nr:galactokinase family protein [Pyrinomonadaceae bacterium]